LACGLFLSLSNPKVYWAMMLSEAPTKIGLIIGGFAQLLIFLKASSIKSLDCKSLERGADSLLFNFIVSNCFPLAMGELMFSRLKPYPLCIFKDQELTG